MKEINFISSGMMGDFIHALSAVKNICERENAKANIYLTDDITRYGYDHWRYGASTAHRDLYDLVIYQSYVNKFSIIPFDEDFKEDYINLNDFRIGLVPPFKTWTKLLSDTFKYDIPKRYKWLEAEDNIMNSIVIHSSTRRQNPYFDWDALHLFLACMSIGGTEIQFVTFALEEYDSFPLSGSSFINVKLVNNMLEMSEIIASADYFIGNQSAPFALASALDVPRLVILDEEPAPFYMGEQEFSKNISWYLNNSKMHLSENCLPGCWIGKLG